ncbi:MAG: NAD/NADP octopine/nopaline dehydrogenase family protein [Thermoplasmatales archaeon]|nr:NAD/NADP octopine/nopaline dehydrogenase family protein [Thermoplasmatales archaeon]
MYGRTKKVEKPSVAVLGAGHGGLAMAAHISMMGFDTRIYTRNPERIRAIQERDGKIELQGIISGFGNVYATESLKDCLDGAHLIMVVVPAMGHAYYAERCAPYLQDGQIVVLNPGRTGGALEFKHVLKSNGCNSDVIVCEAQSLIYVSRYTDVTQAHIFQVKNTVACAALPAYRTPEALKIINKIYPQFVPASNVLETSLDNIGAIFHPGITLLNAARIEDEKSDFEFYIEGVGPTTSKILEKMDMERVEVARKLGIRVHTAREWLYLSYDSAGKTLYDAILGNPAYKGVMAPKTIQHRYLYEDIPYSLVPLEEFGKYVGTETPTISAMVTLASTLLETDFRKEGRTLEKMGIKGYSMSKLRKYITTGA